MDHNHLKEVAAFIREHRSNESNFEALRQKLEEEAGSHLESGTYRSSLQEVKEKYADEYQKAKEKGSSAWPEFEKLVSEFEKTVTEELKKEA